MEDIKIGDTFLLTQEDVDLPTLRDLDPSLNVFGIFYSGTFMPGLYQVCFFVPWKKVKILGDQVSDLDGQLVVAIKKDGERTAIMFPEKAAQRRKIDDIPTNKKELPFNNRFENLDMD